MQGIVYRFESLDSLSDILENDDHDLRLPASQAARDGDWLLATFFVGEDSTSIAGRVRDRGSELRLTFEVRDWERLTRFAAGDAPISIPGADRTSDPDVALAPPGTLALVVNTDDDGLRAIVCQMLKRWGIVTECVASAEEALDWLRPHQAELVVMDVNLPGMAPDEFCRLVRQPARTSTASPPVLLLGTDTRQGEVTAALNAGADDFIAMPFRAPELRCRVLGLLRRSAPPETRV